MPQLLAVSWTMPPVLAPRSIQVALTLNHLQKLGWQTTVLCTAQTGLNKWVPIDSSLEQALGRDYQPLRVNSLERSRPIKALERYLFLEHLVWMFRAISRGKELLRTGKFSGIISFAQPWACHLAGLRLHRLSGLPWVAHFSDPWVDNPYLRAMPWQRLFWRQLEAAVIQDAGAVFFVNSQTADLVMRKYPSEFKKKIRVLPHGFDATFSSGLALSPRPRPRLRLVYTGSFYPGWRTPEGLFRGLEILGRTRALADQLEIRLIGTFAPDYQLLANSLGLSQIVTCRGAVPFAKSIREAAAADVLLVIDAPSDSPGLFLPSKLVDYLAFHKPILGMTPTEGASADLLRQLQCPVAAPNDPDGIAAIVGQLLDQWQSGNLKVSPTFTDVAQRYDIRQTTRQLHLVLEELISNKATMDV